MAHRVRSGAERRLMALCDEIEDTLQEMVALKLQAEHRGAGEKRQQILQAVEELRRTLARKREERRVMLATLLTLSDEGADATDATPGDDGPDGTSGPRDDEGR